MNNIPESQKNIYERMQGVCTKMGGDEYKNSTCASTRNWAKMQADSARRVMAQLEKQYPELKPKPAAKRRRKSSTKKSNFEKFEE